MIVSYEETGCTSSTLKELASEFVRTSWQDHLRLGGVVRAGFDVLDVVGARKLLEYFGYKL